MTRRDGSGKPKARLGRYDAPGDGPIVVPTVELQVPFTFDSRIAARLARREVNPSEAFTVANEAGEYFRAALRELHDDGGEALPYERMTRSPEPSVEITLACCVLARQRMIFVVQKATELGVARIIPVLTEHSVGPEGLEHEKAHAWPGQVIRAARQCRRASLPELVAPKPFEQALAAATQEADILLFLDDRSEDALPPVAAGSRRIALFAGPEGGFSDAEREMLSAHASPWVIGGRVLRAETAVLVGLSAVHLVWGDFRGLAGSSGPAAGGDPAAGCP